MLYISWPALVLLLWACAIWLIPRVNPRNSLYYTSPLLVVYTLALLLLQYINSLELTASELPRYQSLGSECTEEGAVLGCKSLVLLFKVMVEASNNCSTWAWILETVCVIVSNLLLLLQYLWLHWSKASLVPRPLILCYIHKTLLRTY